VTKRRAQWRYVRPYRWDPISLLLTHEDERTKDVQQIGPHELSIMQQARRSHTGQVSIPHSREFNARRLAARRLVERGLLSGPNYYGCTYLGHTYIYTLTDRGQASWLKVRA